MTVSLAQRFLAAFAQPEFLEVLNSYLDLITFYTATHTEN